MAGNDTPSWGVVIITFIVAILLLCLAMYVVMVISSSIIEERYYEEHIIEDIQFKELTGTKQTFGSYDKYDITIETGEMLTTNIANFVVGKKYTMEIYRLSDEGVFRYVESAIETCDGRDD